MGVTIRNKGSYVDLTYSGMFNLRKEIASIYSTSFRDFYEDWCEGKYTNEEGNKMLEKYFIDGTLKEEDEMVLDFLFASDCEGKLPYKSCRRLYTIIKDYDTNKIFGYCGRPQKGTFEEFKKVVECSAKNRLVMFWS